jgi:hypothetical protein
LWNPDAPTSLANNAAITNSLRIGLTWGFTGSNGGTPVIDYEVSWDQGSLTNTYVVLASGILLKSYITTASLTPNMVYKF